tara:strand:+ start:363 stop:839 length:477 start_codon:yes stop_codon:yes gene_type:complete
MRNRIDRPHVIGTFSERALLFERCDAVRDAMVASEAELRKLDVHFTIDLDLAEVRVGFLREPQDRLYGLCSFKRGFARASTAGERTWRVLIARGLLYDASDELERTLYHEFLHGIVGKEPEGSHGPRFSRLEAAFDGVLRPKLVTADEQKGHPAFPRL